METAREKNRLRGFHTKKTRKDGGVTISFLATAEATPNIALVKYWGNRDEELVLPMNSSISVTMDDTLKTRTTIMFSKDFSRDEAWLNREPLKDKDLTRVVEFLDSVRMRAKTSYKARLVSINGFPTAAGLASSASGWAALACACAKALKLNLDSRQTSILARLGSGSASRSVIGGFVEWKSGKKSDGTDSYAEQIASPEHWPEIRNVIAIVDEKKKKVSSRTGMKRTVDTSTLYPKRIEDLKTTLKTVKTAILAKDSPVLFQAIMCESNNMHAVMLDAWPPVMYLNDVSKQIISAIYELNLDGVKAGYTFDAGPNAHVFTLEPYVLRVTKILKEISEVKKIIVCRVGQGPRSIGLPEEHLVDPRRGEVRTHYWDEKTNRIVVEA
jgi:diphosphomevalonate decarboxylase